MSLLLLCSVVLFVDVGMGALQWPGLRVTRLHPGATGLLAAAGLAGWLLISRTIPIPAGATIAALAFALPIYLGVATIRGRSLSPPNYAGDTAGGGYSAKWAALAVAEGTVPALLIEPSGPARGALALLHGAGAHKTFYAWPMIDALLEAGFAVCAIDLDGHGENERVLDFPSVLEDVGVTVTFLRQRFPFVGVVGVSLGGCIAARAVAEGCHVDALAIFESPITIDITPRVVRHEYRTLLRSAAWSLHRYAGTLPLAQAWRTDATRTRIGIVELIQRLDLPGSLRRIDAPLFLCYGDNDGVVSMAQAREIAAAAPQGTPLVIARRATHLSLPVDGRALRALGVWLNRVTAAPALDPHA